MEFPQLYVGFFINMLGQLLSPDEFVLVGAVQSHEVLRLLSYERSKGKWGAETKPVSLLVLVRELGKPEQKTLWV